MYGGKGMTKAYGVTAVVKALIVAYIVTGVLLFGMAFAMYKMGLQERTVDFGVTFIYILATAIGGLVVGKCMKQKKFLWGCLVGALYVLIIFIASFIVTKGFASIANDGISTLLLCLGGGMLGGMIS